MPNLLLVLLFAISLIGVLICSPKMPSTSLSNNFWTDEKSLITDDQKVSDVLFNEKASKNIFVNVSANMPFLVNARDTSLYVWSLAFSSR